MNNRTILELFMLVRSCQNNLQHKYNHRFDEDVEKCCYNFCARNNINITHGSAFKELRHKTYYYSEKCINDIITKGIDTYNLRKNKLINDKELADRLLLERK